MRDVMDEYDERVMIGEIYLPVEKLITYYGEEGSGAHLPFNFQLIALPSDAATIFAAISEYEGALPAGGWPNWVLGNHDKPRIASRVGPAQAQVAAMLLLTLRGTPTLYYGDEIGMHDVAIPAERVRDPQGLRSAASGSADPLANSRDPARTPMQWSGGPNAGFTTGEPWLPLADDHGRINVEADKDDPDSMLALHRRLLELRSAEPALHVGSYRPVGVAGDLLAYVREAEGRRFLVALNFGHAPGALELEPGDARGRVVVGTYPDREKQEIAGRVELRGDEGMVVELE